VNTEEKLQTSRSKISIGFRFVGGILVILLLSLPFMIIGGGGVLTSLYAIGEYLLTGDFTKVKTLAHLKVIVGYGALLALGIGAFRWGRHLTKPSSTEYV